MLRLSESHGVRPLCTAAAVALLTATGLAQPRSELPGTVLGADFGAAIALIGDVDGDGVADVVVGAPLDPTGGPEAGRVDVYSGAAVARAFGSPVAPLFSFFGNPLDRFGHAVAGADLDVDGVADILVGAPFELAGNAGAAGAVHAYSGVDGRELFRWTGTRGGSRFGWAIACDGDHDADGRPDVLVGAPLDATSQPDAGSVSLFAGADGRLLRRRYGSGAGTQLGWSVAFVGELDQPGDARDDYVAGAPGSGRLGADTGAVWTFASQGAAQPAIVDGSAAGERFGAAVAGIGDVDADGRAEFVVGAPEADGSQGMVTAAGRITLVRADGTLGASVGGSAGDRLGSSLIGVSAAPGDFAAGAVGGSYVRVFGTQPGGVGFDTVRTDLSSLPGDRFGLALALGDLDGDGHGDLLVGAPGDARGAGTGRVVALALESLAGLEVSSFTFYLSQVVGLPTTQDNRFGAALDVVPDVDGDGFADLVAGNRATWPDPRPTGAVVLSGRTFQVIRQVLRGVPSGEEFGRAVAGVDDLDGDGRGDVILGAPGTGEVVAYSTGPSLQASAVLWSVRTGGDRFGEAVAAGPDQDRDGVDDVLVGAPGRNGSRPGYVEVRSGRDGLRLLRLVGARIDDRFGRALCRVADVDGDGVDEILVGAEDYAQLHSGADGRLLRHIPSPTGSRGFGTAVAAAGDVDGDGLGDLAISDFGNDGWVYAISTRDGRAIWATRGVGGFDLAGTGDLDEDGIPDLVVSKLGGPITALSGRDGAKLFERSDQNPGGPPDSYGEAVAGHSGIAGSRRGWIAVGAPGFYGLVGILGQTGRLFAYTVPASKARAVPYGAPCAGSSGALPRIGSSSAAVLGANWTLELSHAAPLSSAWLLVGTGRADVRLDPLGLSGCSLLLAGELLAIPWATATDGSAEQALPIPAMPALAGGTLTAQWLVRDRGANALGLVLSDGLDARVDVR
ncbi:MAG: FG-GAP repeat protein [Planctomycetes bacterium]|nr:FG-GAP repeat protein [Planctomycetota bacterium]